VKLLVAFAACALAGCIDDSLVSCGELSCPVGQVCTRGGCAMPGDVTACEGLDDGTACHSTNGGTGTCEGGSCRTGLCGNDAVDIGEACDGSAGVDPSAGQTCAPDCKSIYQCGNGVVDPGELCDDGNENASDGCDACTTTAWNASTAVGMEMGALGSALADPHGVAIDGSGRVFIADTDNSRIVRVELDGSLTSIAGTGTAGFGGDGGPATSALLAAPRGVAVDGIGRLFIADTGNQRIRLVDVAGNISTIAGDGNLGYTGDGAPAIFAELQDPGDVAVDGLGRVAIADTDNNVVREIAVDGSISTVAGTGTPGYRGDAAAAIAAELASPAGVAIDAAGRILIADTANSVVRRIESDGTISTIAGNGSIAYGGDNGPATEAALAFPIGVAVDASGDVFLADAFNQRVRRVDTAGTITTVAGTGTSGFAGDGGPGSGAELASPWGLAIDAQGALWIADMTNQRLRELATDGTISTIAGNGTLGVGGEGGVATGAQLSNPFGVAVDATGRIVIADNFHQRIRRVELDGTIHTIAGTGLQGYSGDGAAATDAELNGPDGVAIDAMGRIYIADTYNHAIRRVDLDGTIHTIAGTGQQGFTGDSGAATSARLYNPQGVAVDAGGVVYIADTYNHRIRRVDTNGVITTIAGNDTAGYGGDGGQASAATLSFPYGIVIDHSGRVVLSDSANNRIRRIETTGTIDTIAGTGTAGYNGDGIAATAAEIYSPYGIAVDNEGRIVISDAYNQRIRRIETDGTISTVIGTGTAGANGDAAAATGAQVAFPIDVAVDALGGVIVADTNNQRIRRVDPATSIITTVAGQVDPGDVGPMASARLVDPQAIALAPSLTLVAGGSSGALEAITGGRVEAVAGRYPQTIATGALARFRTSAFGSVGGVAIDPATGLIYIAETTANKIHVITQVDPAHPETWTIAVLAGDGTSGFRDGPAAIAEFRGPTGLYLDTTAGMLYIADTGNHAIRALALATGAVTTVVNTSHSLGFAGDGGPAATALLFEPTALTRCAVNGDWFIADTGNNRVRRITSDMTITTVLGDGVPASSGEGAPARTFPVDSPRGLACDDFGNLFVSSTTGLRMLPASDAHVVDGSGTVQTIYGSPPRTAFPASVTSCLTAVAVISPTTLQVSDACTGLLVQLDRTAAQ
jgi:cysteine-rich repeat protein